MSLLSARLFEIYPYGREGLLEICRVQGIAPSRKTAPGKSVAMSGLLVPYHLQEGIPYVQSNAHPDRAALRLPALRQPPLAGRSEPSARGDAANADGDHADFGGARAVHGAPDPTAQGAKGAGSGSLHRLQRAHGR